MFQFRQVPVRRFFRVRFGYAARGTSDNMCRRFCHCTESPEPPAWVKRSKDENPITGESEDDFVLPSKFDSLEDRSGVWRGRESGPTTPLVSCEATTDADVDSLSTILSSGFTSPDAVVQALDGCSVNLYTDLVDKMLKRYSNDWIPAFGFFKWVSTTQSSCRPSADTFDSMVDILGKSKQFDIMWSLVGEMVTEKLVSLSTITRVMRRLAGAGRWKDTTDTFRSIEQFGVKKDTAAMNTLLDTLCKERSVMRARDIFFEARDSVPPDAKTFNILIHGWCKAGKLEEAGWTMEDMRQSGFSPCVISYTSLIEAYCLDKNFRQVDVILEEMQASGCSPNVVTYTIIMHSLGKVKETQEALRIYDMMKNKGVDTDTSFYSSLIYILSKAGRLQDAYVIYEEMNKNGTMPNLTTYNTLISAACLHSQEDIALKFLMKMEENSCKPDIKTYAPLLKYCCKRKRIRLLYFLLEDMLKKDVSLDLGTYTLLVQGLCRNGKLDHSCLFFEKMVKKGFAPRHHTYKMLLEALEGKKLQENKENIQKLMEQAEKTNPFAHLHGGKNQSCSSSFILQSVGISSDQASCCPLVTAFLSSDLQKV